MMGLFDTHAHLYDKAFDRDREEVIHHICKTLDYVVIPSEDLVTSEKAVALAESHPSLYAAVGIHPQVTKDATEEALAAIAALARTHDKVKAVGEIGLDHHWPVPRQEQYDLFEAQLQLAKELDLPVSVHDREAHAEMYELLRKYKPRGALHCYSGSKAKIGRASCRERV